MSNNATNRIPPPVVDEEALAIFLCVGVSLRTMKSRVDLKELWNEKEESVRVAYRRRARRLIKLWKTP